MLPTQNSSRALVTLLDGTALTQSRHVSPAFIAHLPSWKIFSPISQSSKGIVASVNPSRVRRSITFIIMTCCEQLIYCIVMDNKKDYDYMFKLILVGAASVGKSQILLRYTKNEFSELSQTTLGVEYATKLITTPQGNRIKFQIWDTAGQERYRALMKTYYKGASAALIVYDITNEESFLNVENEQRLMKDYIKGDIIKMIVGNKIDLEESRAVSKQRGLEYAEEKKIAFYEVSAKENTNIDLIFTRMAEEFEKAIAMSEPGLDKKQSSKSTKQIEQVGKKKEDVLVLNKKTEQQREQQSKDSKKKKCCES